MGGRKNDVTAIIDVALGAGVELVGRITQVTEESH